ncbi:MAG: hypothetical protein OXF88_01390 [Rhodobacteraceae bacterium]|nr:hypothetical protein [Paracoccaceae bacterium]MCY4141059.1 hypothetical protein [Paracoccaceae bacterium]
MLAPHLGRQRRRNSQTPRHLAGQDECTHTGIVGQHVRWTERLVPHEAALRRSPIVQKFQPRSDLDFARHGLPAEDGHLITGNMTFRAERQESIQVLNSFQASMLDCALGQEANKKTQL